MSFTFRVLLTITQNIKISKWIKQTKRYISITKEECYTYAYSFYKYNHSIKFIKKCKKNDKISIKKLQKHM